MHANGYDETKFARSEMQWKCRLRGTTVTLVNDFTLLHNQSINQSKVIIIIIIILIIITETFKIQGGPKNGTTLHFPEYLENYKR